MINIPELTNVLNTPGFNISHLRDDALLLEGTKRDGWVLNHGRSKAFWRGLLRMKTFLSKPNSEPRREELFSWAFITTVGVYCEISLEIYIWSTFFLDKVSARTVAVSNLKVEGFHFWRKIIQGIHF